MSAENKLYGLVLCGGNSLRMGSDKSQIDYYGKQQKYFLYELLEEFCDKVFISCRYSQSAITNSDYNIITDLHSYENTGPMAGLLTFQAEFPGISVLAAGCDYPFINRESIAKLIENRNDKAVCYLNEESDKDIFEPLLTIYESTFLKIILENFKNKNYSLSRILEKEMVKTIEPPSELIFRNVNSGHDYFEAKKLIELLNYNYVYKPEDPGNDY